MRDFAKNVRIALRGLRRTPSFTAAAVLILGFGIGTSVAMFTVFRAVLLERLPVRDADRVVVLSTYKDPAVEFGLLTTDLKDSVGRAARCSAVGGFAHYGAPPVPLLDGDRSLLLGRVLVDGSFFDVLGARPVLGRLLHPDDDLDGAVHNMVHQLQVLAARLRRGDRRSLDATSSNPTPRSRTRSSASRRRGSSTRPAPAIGFRSGRARTTRRSSESADSRRARRRRPRRTS